MSRLEVYKVNPDEVYGVVNDNIEACRDTLTLPSDDKYYSCASIYRVPSILKDGLLSKRL